MIKRIIRIFLLLATTLILVLFISTFSIQLFTQGKTYYTAKNIPKNKVGIILGTSKRLTTGKPNPYYHNRIAATVRLFNAKKIEFVLVSGDNATLNYNEPYTIKKDLIKAGIPEDRIFLDYAGFRTLDSMVRAKYVFGLDSVTVISQKFHNERAIFLAERKGLHAIGFNAKDITGSDGLKVRLREYFARVKVFIDLTFNTQPKFYGKKIEIK
ncbi:SanA/YdcF family protein [Sediminicola sp. 1XM1-17]|uniref:SanA/YdcF family protein n=1 Tax=Sediminicola sp. 1XM1-17 TaxID=3127702 RepID=UPI0030778EDA